MRLQPLRYMPLWDLEKLRDQAGKLTDAEK
jgi:hypothetical protein